MKLKELILAVQEKNLSKEQLEAFRDELVGLFALIQFEKADLEKAEAMYFLEHPQKTDIATKRSWKATPEGQRLIELSHYTKATEKMISNLKSRLFQVL